MRTEFGFARTSCDCQECTHNCEHMPGYLIPADLPRLYKLAAQKGETMEEWAQRCLLASPGAIVMTRDGQQVRIPTLVPARQDNGHCIHLRGGRCLVHEGSPFGCAFMDAHMDGSDVDRRSLEGLKAVARDWSTRGPYSALWMMLHTAGKEAPSPAESRRRMKAAWEEKMKGDKK